MYVGHLLIAPATWLAAAIASRKRVYAGCRGPGAWSAGTGDPVFLLGDEARIAAHAHVCDSGHMTVNAARAKFSKWLYTMCGDPSTVPLYTVGEKPGEMGIDVLYLSELTPIEPPLVLREFRISPFGRSSVQQVGPEETLAILKALPPAAQTAWTKRVVARYNDIPPFGPGGPVAK